MAELITVEFAGLADRWAGPGRVYDVRVWWCIENEDTNARVRRDAAREVRRALDPATIGEIEFVSWDLDTYKSPHMNAVIKYRVLSPNYVAYRKRMREAHYPVCQGCNKPGPGQLVHVRATGTDVALCFGCWHPMRADCRVLHWIKANGRIQF